jgi:hypothetical protein
MSTFTGVPERKNIRTSLDLIAQLINIYRLPGEKLSSFKERVLDNYIHPGAVTYTGLYNGIARELGLDAHSRGVLIDVERDSLGLPLNNTAGLEITPKFFTLYSDHALASQQVQFDLYDRTDSFFISTLINQINATSGWEAVNVGLNEFAHSSKLQQLTSLNTVRAHPLDASKVNNFVDEIESGNYLTGDILFSAANGINKQVTVPPTAENEFMVDYDNSVIFTGQIPTGTLTFQYETLPILVKWSDISLNSFLNDEFMDLITEQIENEDNVIVDGIPTQEGARYINNLLAVHRQYWGS